MTGDCVTRQTPLLSRRPNIVNGEIPFCLPYICDDMSRAVTELSTQRVSAERRGVIEIPSANLNCQLIPGQSEGQETWAQLLNLSNRVKRLFERLFDLTPMNPFPSVTFQSSINTGGIVEEHPSTSQAHEGGDTQLSETLYEVRPARPKLPKSGAKPQLTEAELYTRNPNIEVKEERKEQEGQLMQGKNSIEVTHVPYVCTKYLRVLYICVQEVLRFTFAYKYDAAFSLPPRHIHWKGGTTKRYHVAEAVYGCTTKDHGINCLGKIGEKVLMEDFSRTFVLLMISFSFREEQMRQRRCSRN
ncbi:hypothetical protein RB195_015373 [Necator americanus]|uniref:Uncharacterized protein n=1 Tax=Necator americanus TaxID=51031 RepID=A0ABR1E5F6_NECAM